MSQESFCLLLLSAFLICSTPGPNMLHVLTRSIQLGVKNSLPSMAGCVSGLALLLLISAAGLGLFLQRFPLAFVVLRLIGLVYLVFLGWQAWRASASPLKLPVTDRVPSAMPLQLYLNGLAVGASNPKLLLFGVSFMPQFIHPNEPQWPQYAIILGCFVLCELCWYGVYGLGGRYVARFLSSPSVLICFNKGIALLFFAFGAAMFLL